MELASSATNFKIPAVFADQATRKKVREFQNWLMIKLVPSFKLRTVIIKSNGNVVSLSKIGEKANS